VSTFEWPIRVYYEDTDSSGVVYYANYLRFMERARTEWLRSLGFEQDRLSRDEGTVFVVHSASIEFLRPARFNDLLTVISGLQHRGRASLTFTQNIIRQQEASQPCCTGKVKVACVNADSFRPQPIPEPLLKELADVD
jgi:acyl-CoA thioester hydrolase